jgi:hypothetical protein
LMHISLVNLVIQQLLKSLGSMYFKLRSLIIIKFSDSESNSLLFVHLPELHLFMQPDLKS